MIISAYRLLETSQLVNEGATLVTGFLLNASVDGGNVELYDGMDDVSGRLVYDVHGWANDVNIATFDAPILFGVGLYVKVVANVHRFTVNYIPLRGDSLLEVYPGFVIAAG